MKRCRSSNPTPTNRSLQPGYVFMQEVFTSVSFGHTPLKIIENHSVDFFFELTSPQSLHSISSAVGFYVPRYWALSFDRITTINPPLRAARTAYRIRRDIPAHRAATAFLVDPGIRLSQPSPVRCPENPGISERSQDPNNVEQPLWANRWYGMERE